MAEQSMTAILVCPRCGEGFEQKEDETLCDKCSAAHHLVHDPESISEEQASVVIGEGKDSVKVYITQSNHLSFNGKDYVPMMDWHEADKSAKLRLMEMGWKNKLRRMDLAKITLIMKSIDDIVKEQTTARFN